MNLTDHHCLPKAYAGVGARVGGQRGIHYTAYATDTSARTTYTRV